MTCMVDVMDALERAGFTIYNALIPDEIHIAHPAISMLAPGSLLRISFTDTPGRDARFIESVEDAMYHARCWLTMMSELVNFIFPEDLHAAHLRETLVRDFESADNMLMQSWDSVDRCGDVPKGCE